MKKERKIKNSFNNLIVTGGCGFIGSNFIRHLIKDDNFSGRIINLDKLTYAGNPENLEDIATEFGPRYVFQKVDICDAVKLEKVFSEYDIDAVCHFAAESHVDRSIKDPGSFIQTNIIGTFNQPDFVICDQELLKTLPEDEYLSGLAEMIKSGFIGDAGLIGEIEKNVEPILKRETSLLSKLIARTVKIKASIVSEDEKESGIRMLLNFGHTFGHAIESQSGLKHGFAVAGGMKIAADISVGMGFLKPVDRDRLLSLLNSFNLLTDNKISYDEVKKYILQDKKRSGDSLNFIILEKTGKAVVKKIPAEILLDYYTGQNIV